MPLYEQAYQNLINSAAASLSNVDSAESAQKFIDKTVADVRQQAREVPEFYLGEFAQLLKEAVWNHAQSFGLELELAVEEAKDEGKAASAELTARLEAAIKAGDRDGQHAVWREREVRLTVVQAKVDDATARIGYLDIRRRACEAVVTALGF